MGEGLDGTYQDAGAGLRGFVGRLLDEGLEFAELGDQGSAMEREHCHHHHTDPQLPPPQDVVSTHMLCFSSSRTFL